MPEYRHLKMFCAAGATYAFNRPRSTEAGMWADVVVFIRATVRDLATFENPNQLSEGMKYVLVNGVAVIDQGKQTGALPGKVLRGAGYVR